jgi:hypothetical protein
MELLTMAYEAILRLLARTPVGAADERRYRRLIGMARHHPERMTLPARPRHRSHLDAWARQMWPDREWAEIVEEHLRWRG